MTMTNTTHLRELIEQLESAESGSRELDAAIQRAMGPDFPLHFSGVGVCNAFTTSLDAALTLVPEGWSWSLGEMRGIGKFRGWLNDHNTPDGLAVRHIDADATTPALALCIAALRARGV